MSIYRPAEVPDEDRFLMRECGEGVSPVVTPHPASSDSAKRKSFDREMNDGVVDHHGATGGASLEEFRHLFVCAEHIQTEGLVPGVYQLDSFLRIVHRQDG